MNGYDIIGDIHANADGLRRLLRDLGYAGPDFVHPDGRVPIYVGDFINRGTQNREVIEIVQKTMQNGAEAVMGNHEFKAICYARPGIHGHIRPHTLKSAAEHAGFLEEYPYGSDAYKSVIAWFESLPVYLQKPEFRVVHACWNDDAINVCWPHIRKRDGGLKESAYRAYDTENPTPFTQALDVLLKGPRYKLPRGVTCMGSNGDVSKETRLLWWREKGSAPSDMLDKGDQVEAFLSNDNKKTILSLRNKFNYASKRIVFIGHYNILGQPNLVDENVACLNFKGHMVAYRWDEGDKELQANKLVCI